MLARSLSRFSKYMDDDHLRIVRGLIVVSFFLLIGKFAGAAKEMAVAYRYGVGETVDAYMLIFAYLTWLPAIWLAVLNSVFVPLVHKLGSEEKTRFNRQLLGATILLSVVFTILLLLAIPLLLKSQLLALSSTGADLWYQLAMGLIPVVGLSFLVAQFSALLLAAERHANTLLTALPPLILCLFILLWPIDGSGWPFIVGTVAGIALQVVGLVVLLLRAKLWHSPSYRFESPAWRSFGQGVGIMFLATFLMSFVTPIGMTIAAGLGPGNVASLGFTNALLMLFLTLGATAVGRAILPVLSNSNNSLQHKEGIAIKWAMVMFILGAVAAVMVWFLAPTLVRILYERGAFTSRDTAVVADAIRLGVTQFPFYFAGVVLAQLFASLGLYKHIFVTALIGLAVNPAACLLLVGTYEFSGVVLANTIMYLATSSYFMIIIFQRRRQHVQIVD